MGQVTIDCELQLERVAGAASFDIPLDEASSLMRVLELLCDQAKPELKTVLLNKTSKLNPGILVFINEQMIATELSGNIQVRPGDQVLLYPAISGG